jgi:17beta-estradiol 17-dehydrogenase / very-long-chain 3-oxoacyl-CoA reductase
MIAPRTNQKTRYGGGWALVTGATDTIGQQYALQLARSGFNVILVDSDEAQMTVVESEIK